jgi:hypothetical protein
MEPSVLEAAIIIALFQSPVGCVPFTDTLSGCAKPVMPVKITPYMDLLPAGNSSLQRLS